MTGATSDSYGGIFWCCVIKGNTKLSGGSVELVLSIHGDIFWYINGDGANASGSEVKIISGAAAGKISSSSSGDGKVSLVKVSNVLRESHRHRYRVVRGRGGAGAGNIDHWLVADIFPTMFCGGGRILFIVIIILTDHTDFP